MIERKEEGGNIKDIISVAFHENTTVAYTV